MTYLLNPIQKMGWGGGVEGASLSSVTSTN